MTTSESSTALQASTRARSASAAPSPTSHRTSVHGRRSRALRGGAAPHAFTAPFCVLYVGGIIMPIVAAIDQRLTELVGVRSPEDVRVLDDADLTPASSFGTAVTKSLIYVLVAVL